jgi:uncharacterized protein (TIRG00374 family)
MLSLSNLRQKIIVSLLIGLAVLLILSFLSDINAVGASFSTFAWQAIPLILLFTVLNYLLRWLKWDYYLRRLKLGQGVSYADSGLIFTAGMVMAVTPGKIGEVLKSYLLKRVNGTAMTVSAPVVFAERLTDGLAMLLLMGLGLTLYPPARPIFFLLLMLTLLGIVLLQYRRLCYRLIDFIATLPVGRRLAPRLHTLYASTVNLLDWRILLISTIISVVSWGFECLAFYFVLTGLGVPPSSLLLLQAMFIFAASTLFGLVSFLPGGLGVSEVTSTGMLVAMVGTSAAVATAATIIIRFCTLWFGVLLGIIALAWFGRRYSGERPDLSTTEVLPVHDG